MRIDQQFQGFQEKTFFSILQSPEISTPMLDVEIHPYIVDPKSKNYSISDKKLSFYFRKMVLEGTHSKVFIDGSIKTTGQFIEYCKTGIELFSVKIQGEDVGLFWLRNFLPQTDMITYCFFKKFWGEKSFNIRISQLCIDYIFNRTDHLGNYKTNVLLGITPETNKLAVKFMQKCGLFTLGKIPKLLFDKQKEQMVGGILSYKSRDTADQNNTIMHMLMTKLLI